MLKGGFYLPLRIVSRQKLPPCIAFLSNINYKQRCYGTAASASATKSVVKAKLSKKKKSSALKETVKMPRTEMPLSMKGVLEREARIRKLFDHDSLYRWQENDPERTESFVLHDGPPYANGEPHVGHALNKIIKVICCRPIVTNCCQRQLKTTTKKLHQTTNRNEYKWLLKKE